MYMDENTGLYATCRQVNTYTYMYRVFEEESTIIRETLLRLNNINITQLTYCISEVGCLRMQWRENFKQRRLLCIY